MIVHCLEFRHFRSGTLVGYADLRLDLLKLHRCPVFRSESRKKLSVGIPKTPKLNGNRPEVVGGEVVRFRSFSLPTKELYREFQMKASVAVMRHTDWFHRTRFEYPRLSDYVEPSGPTEFFEEKFVNGFNYFNKTLFGDELSRCYIVPSITDGALGEYDDDTETIGINPLYLYRPEIDTFSTLVHEMAHHWQFTLGKPGKNNYHNTEFARKMESLGLVCSDSGMPGGAKTGSRMSHYILQGGPFEQAYLERATWLEARRLLKRQRAA